MGIKVGFLAVKRENLRVFYCKDYASFNVFNLNSLPKLIEEVQR